MLAACFANALCWLCDAGTVYSLSNLSAIGLYLGLAIGWHTLPWPVRILQAWWPRGKGVAKPFLERRVTSCLGFQWKTSQPLLCAIVLYAMPLAFPLAEPDVDMAF